MGLKSLLGLEDGVAERICMAFERLAASAERQNRGFLSDGPSRKLTPETEQVFYTNDEEQAYEEAKRYAHELSSGHPVGEFEDVPSPEDPETGLPWAEPQEAGSSD
jgi:hypothetical protein